MQGVHPYHIQKYHLMVKTVSMRCNSYSAMCFFIELHGHLLCGSRAHVVSAFINATRMLRISIFTRFAILLYS